MASQQDTQNRKAGSCDKEISFNQQVAESQRDKTSLRAAKVSENPNDIYNPSRLAKQDAGV